jgi:hypothetical protein
VADIAAGDPLGDFSFPDLNDPRCKVMTKTTDEFRRRLQVLADLFSNRHPDVFKGEGLEVVEIPGRDQEYLVVATK